MDQTCDILISGGGIAGLTAAATFGSAGFRVICVDPAPPITERDVDGSDLRTTAVLQPARDLLERCGLWARLAGHAAPLQIMRIVDAGGEHPEPRVVRDFNAADISDQPFGWNLPNWLLRRELVAALADLPNVDFRPGVGTTQLFTRLNEARVTLTDGSQQKAKLVLACDGRNSPMREAAGIPVKTTRYGQKALAFAVTHPVPHENVSTEIHRSGGPFTLVPLPDYQGLPSSAVVWMERGPRASELLQMETAEFEAAMTRRSCGLLGDLTLASRRTIWPIISQSAERLNGERLALMAEAAHVVPPIGAQGLNMSLSDLRCLLELAEARPEGLGDAAMLEAYNKARHKDIMLRVKGIDLLNRTSMLAPRPLRDLRAFGLNALYSMAPVRRTLMQMGLGVK
ncbi:2-octaprenyl-6-methoxyphenyl hydroxylase [Phaeobacter gallaeciensis]|uniref:2-octaprenyl-6-methoxyphenyl hydroxylase n=1 Tax=Phaeobacter gallaeciensis TaxID=60890 RepID=A0A1B0ZPV2_9RHOB|nr:MULTISPECIES: UbiH/UbiF family hydroxylase [Phaeobacter]MEE2817941.1 UbiH/UbiF family hydroxylase [Pseudomonadota bacterium]ANP36195.1 2-octaprenyl-6-methoxyphenyl hydroxylase [Phaeobacter gallaeciensis]MDE4063338.1 UbiH/UbiF family hydroxylase [Phaeobacter gallaeciensis]MDE4126375.1 UbiH/UbiF family hydroxylase [Phaeobacter gallaeciensis]MDE4130849.1 UbiH/UbiF family hydroxylase [Phaeobacter gallaeciensis]